MAEGGNGYGNFWANDNLSPILRDKCRSQISECPHFGWVAHRGAIIMAASPEYLACDIDGDGEVTSGDARAILCLAVGLKDEE